MVMVLPPMRMAMRPWKRAPAGTNRAPATHGLRPSQTISEVVASPSPHGQSVTAFLAEAAPRLGAAGVIQAASEPGPEPPIP